MRKMLLLTPLLALAACGGNPSTPPRVSYGYGAGNGDGVQYPGAKPTFSFANGLGQDVAVSQGNMPTVSRAYGADEVTASKVTEQMAPSAPTQLAAPATGHPANNNNHS